VLLLVVDATASDGFLLDYFLSALGIRQLLDRQLTYAIFSQIIDYIESVIFLIHVGICRKHPTL